MLVYHRSRGELVPLPTTNIKVNGPGGEVTIQVEDLGEDMLEQFRAILSAALNGREADHATFGRATLAFLDRVRGNAEAQDGYFNNFGSVWFALHSAGATQPALRVWEQSLAPVYEWEATRGARVHKGTPHYFAAGTAIAGGDFDTGFIHLHRAIEEDRLTGVDPTTMPPWKLVTLDAASMNHFWRDTVQQVADFLNGRVSRYRAECATHLTLEDVRRRLFADVRLREVAFSFVYSLFRARRQVMTDARIVDTVFAPLLRVDLIANIYVVMEEILRLKWPQHDKLAVLAESLSSTYGYTAHRPPSGGSRKITEMVNARFKTDANATLMDLIDSKFGTPPISRADSAIAIAAPLRNFGSHRIAGRPVVATRFDDVLQLALNGVFLAVERTL